MTKMRRTGALFGACCMLLVVGWIAPSPTSAQTEMSIQTPLTMWSAPTDAGLDGYGDWMATFNEPTAGVGQSPPYYEYLHEFYFQGSESWGHVSLEKFEDIKVASLYVSDEEEGRSHAVSVLFPWEGGRFYFTMVLRQSPGVWIGYAYDYTAATWTTIGAVLVPTRLALLEPVSVTGVSWEGGLLPSCDAYPLADMVRVAPTGFLGGATLASVSVDHQNEPADCPATISEFAPQWDRYQVGAPAGSPAAATASESPSNSGNSVLGNPKHRQVTSLP